MNTSRIANELIRLRLMTCFWGDIYTGTKAQLNAIGFGVGCVFPGEPNAAKKTCKLPLAHGYKKVSVEISRDQDSGTHFLDLIFDVHAFYLENFPDFRGPPVQFASGVVAQWGINGDTYIGTAPELIQAGIIRENQLPGMVGCGKCTTTFDAAGKVFSRGFGTWRQAGFKVVKRSGNKIHVCFIVGPEEWEARRIRYDKQEDVYKLACLEAKRMTIAAQSAPGPRPALRLVWSA